MQSSVDLQFFCIWDPSLLWFEKAPADIMALFSWLQNRHKIRVVGGRPVERSMMSVTLVQSIKCSEVKGNFYSMEKCWCSVHNPHSYSSPSDINCTLFLKVFFFKKGLLFYCIQARRWLPPPEHWRRCIESATDQ